MADKVIENLITKLSFQYDRKNIEKFNNSMKTVVKGLVGVVASSGAAVAGIFTFTKSVAETNDKTGKLSERIGVDIEAMQELGYIAELNGGSIGSMNSSLESLSKITSEAARGMGSGVETFGMLGLSATDATGRIKSADEMLFEISDSVAGLGTQAEKLEFAQKLGIGSDLLLSIQNGSDAMRKQIQRAKELNFTIGEEGAKEAADYNDSLLDVKTIFKGLSSVLASKLMPIFTKAMLAFKQFFIVNKKIIKSGITAFFQRMVKFLSGVVNIGTRVYSVIDVIIQGFGGWENAIMLVVGAFTALNASFLIIPILLGLIIEDFVKFQTGGDSAIGALLSKFPKLTESLHILLGWIGKIGEGWKLLFSDELDNAIEGAGMMLRDISNWFSKLGDQVINFGVKIAESFINPINKGVELLNKIPGLNIGMIGGAQEKNPVPTAAAGQNTSNITNNQTTNESKPSINIQIDGGNTADVRKTITNVLNEQYAGAHTNLKSAVEY